MKRFTPSTAKYDDRSDDAALTAARALSASCPGPAGGRASSRVGMIFYARRDFEAAIAAFKEAIRAKPDAQMYMSLCGLYSEANHQRKALETCREGSEARQCAGRWLAGQA